MMREYPGKVDPGEAGPPTRTGSRIVGVFYLVDAFMMTVVHAPVRTVGPDGIHGIVLVTGVLVMRGRRAAASRISAGGAG
jgi:hypothetical protein